MLLCRHPQGVLCTTLLHCALQYFNIVGYSRSKMNDEEFRDLISENLTCRVTGGKDCGREMEEYLARCFYVSVGSSLAAAGKSITPASLAPVPCMLFAAVLKHAQLLLLPC